MNVQNCTRRLLLASLAAVFSAVLSPAPAEEKYPSRPVRIIVPFAAGGVADSTSRIVAEKLSEKLGQRFYIENQPGAGGIVAARNAMSAPPDGYTLIMLTNGTAVSVSLFEKLPFDPVKDFVAVSSLGFFDFAFVTSASSGFKTLGDFIAAAKAKPGALNVGTINVGSTQNLSAELFKTAAGIDFTLVPFRGNHEAEVALLQGNVSLVIDSYSVLQGNIADGKLKALASSGATRAESTPDLPTVQESGVGNYDVVSWNALFARAGTPAEVINTLNAALQAILGEAETRKKMLLLGIEAKAGPPDAIEARLKSDIDKWRAVIENAHIPKQ
ncbi:MAG TPA: tripartite tricarboxylate transporter substrate binding protein [Bradyrhizobium sp.]|uniref:Bug family tripartite tricarboxylate transporter substrate binding protein n=1 Tax=Bradyrhizobium sp. TaxID=376 RepID=UPI002D7F1E37|nr:tripartite tricarboxylate transporter substrate binding protein [Bradyrhizobium sp.]HET7889437.1 tripartite tricarboxylate transporter substrate binding protein [Bradyrhizobium sp.]